MGKYRLYIDESGDHRYGRRDIVVSKLSFKEKVIEIPLDEYADMEDDRKRYLCLTGCVIESAYYEKTFSAEMESLKKRHFSYDPDDPLIFHREDMVNKRGPFHRLRDKERETAFNADLLEFLGAMDYRIINVVIDKKKHVENYGKAAYHPYHYCLTAMLERYCGLLTVRRVKGDVLAESRGGKEDDRLKDAYRQTWSGGSDWHQKTHFQNVLTSKEIKLKKKEHNIAGLQLSDLLSHPLKMQTLEKRGLIPAQKDFGSVIATVVDCKFNRRLLTGQADGYGRVFL
jgi:hypothetical protein